MCNLKHLESFCKIQFYEKWYICYKHYWINQFIDNGLISIVTLRIFVRVMIQTQINIELCLFFKSQQQNGYEPFPSQISSDLFWSLYRILNMIVCFPGNEVKLDFLFMVSKSFEKAYIRASFTVDLQVCCMHLDLCLG